jgi:hypothetical protein
MQFVGGVNNQAMAYRLQLLALWVPLAATVTCEWVGSGRPYHPHEFLIMSDQDGDYDGPSNGWLVGYIEHNYQSGGIPRLALQDNKAINTSSGARPTIKFRQFAIAPYIGDRSPVDQTMWVDDLTLATGRP